MPKKKLPAMSAKPASLAERLNQRPVPRPPVRVPSALPPLTPGRTVELVLPAPFAATHARLGRDRATGQARGYLDPRYAAWRVQARTAVAAGMQAARVAPPVLHAPVRVDVLFLSPRTERRPDWAPADLWSTGEPLWRPVRPDVENFTEAVHDALQGWAENSRSGIRVARDGALEDDGAVVLGLVADVMLGIVGEPRTIVRISVLPSLRIEDGARLLLGALARHL